MQYDVVVCGGGTAGVIAAVQAGRARAKTLLVEKNGMLGGTITVADVTLVKLFFARERQVIAGIGWELVSRCVTETGGTLPVAGDPQAQRDIHVNPSLYAALCDEIVLDANVELLLHAMVAAVTPHEEGWQVTLCTKTGLEQVTARVLIDCTGDANAVTIAGFPVVIPEIVQPASLVCHVAGFNAETLDLNALNQAFQTAVQRSEANYTDGSWNSEAPNLAHWIRRAGRNANHIFDINARDSRGKTSLEVEARRAVLRLYRFLRAQPGFEQYRIDGMATECGVRETTTIVGEHTITVEEYLAGTVWDDSICYAFYPTDLHAATGQTAPKRHLAAGVIPTVCLRAMRPAGSRDLLVAGRCIASDRLANSALRVQAVCMATGQAAGAAAALAAQRGTEVAAVPMPEIRRLLKAHRAIVPE